MKGEDLVKLAMEAADAIAPALVVRGVTVSVVVGHPNGGWAATTRGDRPVAERALARAAEDAKEDEGWGSSPMPGSA